MYIYKKFKRHTMKKCSASVPKDTSSLPNTRKLSPSGPDEIKPLAGRPWLCAVKSRTEAPLLPHTVAILVQLREVCFMHQ